VFLIEARLKLVSVPPGHTDYREMVTGPTLAVDTAALNALAREFAKLRDGLSSFATVHEHSPVTDQPSGKAVSAVTASANHMTGACADGLLAFGESVAAAARMYDATDSAGAQHLSTAMPAPK
jgi:hypothetical protein